MKNSKYYVLTAVVLALSACSREEYGAPDKDKYLYDIPQTTLLTDAVTGAYYTVYESPVNAEKSPEEPLLGYYTTAGEGILQAQIDWADEAALDFFIFSWGGSPGDKVMVDDFRAARKEGGHVRYVIRYSTTHLGLSNDFPLQGNAKYQEMIADFADFVGVYLTDDSYYRLPDGRPVLLFSPANLSSSELLSADYSVVIPRLKDDLKSFFGVEPYIIGEIATGWVAPSNYASHMLYSFDGITVNDWKTNYYDRYYGYFSFLDLNWNNWKTTLERRGTDFIPCVYPSYNDRKNSATSYYYTFSADGDVTDYVNFCNVAKRNVGTENIVLINSWNNWVYGTNLEPSSLKGERFLAVTREQFRL